MDIPRSGFGVVARQTLAEKHNLHPSEVGRALFFFVLPFLMAGAFILGIYLIFPSLTDGPFPVIGTGMAAYFFPPAGKESVIPIMVNLLRESPHSFSAFEAIFTGTIAIAFVDIITGLFLMWNFDYFVKVPVLGPILLKMEVKGHAYLEKKGWVRRLAFVGVVLFVIFPFQGSGGVGGTIMGRIVGLDKRKVWYAVSTGAISGCLAISIISYYLGEAILHSFKSPVFQTVGMLILLLVLVWVVYVFWWKKRNNKKKGGGGKKEANGVGDQEEQLEPDNASD